MNKKINRLSMEQANKIPQYLDKWLRIGLSTFSGKEKHLPMGIVFHADAARLRSSCLSRQVGAAYRRAFLKDREYKNETTGELEIQEPAWGSPWKMLKTSYVDLEAKLLDTIETEKNE
jgi:hypothetical protein